MITLWNSVKLVRFFFSNFNFVSEKLFDEKSEKLQNHLKLLIDRFEIVYRIELLTK